MSDDDRQPVYLFEGFRLDARRRVLFGSDGQPIPLTSRLFDTLLYLVERPGELVTKEKLLEAIWPHVVVEEQSLGKTISALRKALGEKPEEHRFIVTKHGRGYRFVAQVSVVADTMPTAGGSEPARVSAKSVRHRYAIAAVIVLVAVGAVLVGARDQSPDSSFHVRPWAVERGGQRGPVWSPDGRSTAFTARSNIGDPFHLYVRALDDRVARPVVRFDPAEDTLDTAPAQWTDDGKILYWHPPGLWAVSPVAAQPVLLANIKLDGLGPGLGKFAVVPGKNMHVTRDASAVAGFGQAEDGSIGVWTAKLPEARFEPYEPAPFASRSLLNNPFLRFSPDGKNLLLMWTAGPRGDEAWLLPFPPDPTNPARRVLERMPLTAGAEFSWLPDNRHVAVTTGSPSALYLADIETGAFRLLPGVPTGLIIPVVSPDGDRLIYTDHSQLDFDVVTLDLRTMAVTPLIATGRREVMPSWGTHTGASALVYVTDRSGEWEIWLHEPPEPDRPIVTADDFATATEIFMAPSLSPDGERVIYVRGELGGTPSLWMSSLAGGPPERVTNEDALEAPGSWSPDGTWYAYVMYDGVSPALKKVRTTGQATPVTLQVKIKDGRWLPVWSPDGAWILLPNDGLLLSPDGATRRELKVAPAQCAFARTEPLLYCIRSAPPRDLRPPLVAVDFEGNVARTLGFLRLDHSPSTLYTPATRLSPTLDGNGVTYSVAIPSQNLWLIEGLAAIDLP